ncbi:dihydromonapterin reductase [Thalassotalea aquiviva]|uniref:dihydromonapterin reductase n=1 Tax=Thalassotalea aquiviva TaxID=3242415 RepID=UPI00352A3178
MNKSPIVITGAGQRLGLALAKELIQAGESLVISYRTEKPSIKALSKLGAHCIHADFASQDGIKGFIDEIIGHYQSIRAIVHNASDWLAESADIEPHILMSKMLQVHVQAPYQINLALTPLLERYYNDTKCTSDVIHLTDFVVDKGSKKHIAYCASKAALANLTLSFASKLAPKVKVNSIAPALLMFNEHDDEAYKQKALKKSLLQIEPGEHEGVKAVQYLLSSNYITGHTLHLNGGRNIV